MSTENLGESSPIKKDKESDEEKRLTRRAFLQVGAGAVGVAGALAGGVVGLDALVEHGEKIEMEGKIIQKDEVVVINKYSSRKEVSGGGIVPGAFLGGLLFGTTGAVIGGAAGNSVNEIIDQPYISVRFPNGNTKDVAVSSETFNALAPQDHLEIESIVDEKTKELIKIKSLRKLGK